jgi:hypothetical protein
VQLAAQLASQLAAQLDAQLAAQLAAQLINGFFVLFCWLKGEACALSLTRKP